MLVICTFSHSDSINELPKAEILKARTFFVLITCSVEKQLEREAAQFCDYFFVVFQKVERQAGMPSVRFILQIFGSL